MKPTSVYLVGIGGAGLSAIATVLLEQGYTVSGSDLQASPITERLARLGATVHIGHASANLGDVDPLERCAGIRGRGLVRAR